MWKDNIRNNLGLSKNASCKEIYSSNLKNSYQEYICCILKITTNCILYYLQANVAYFLLFSLSLVTHFALPKQEKKLLSCNVSSKSLVIPLTKNKSHIALIS